MADWTLAAVPLEEALAIVAAVLGAGVGLVSSVAAARQARQAAEAVARARVSRPESAIGAVDLQALGDYVYETLGPIPVGEYASNPSAQLDVTSALEGIERFLDDETMNPTRPKVPAEEVTLARGALAEGDAWQALVRLRMAIEVALRDRAAQLDIPVPERAGAGRLVKVLEDAGGLPPEASVPLRYAIDVANRAVHGEPVPLELADEAIHTASRALGFDR